MNIFKENIDFLKDMPLDAVLKADEEFFSVMKSIRERLGDKKYWLDNYVEKVLEAINNRQATECSEDGFEANYTLRHLCTAILNGEEPEHPLYSEVKESLEKYRNIYQEYETVRSLAIITAFPEYMKIAVKEYLQETAEDGGSMRMTLFGYQIKNGKAFIDKEKAAKVQKLFDGYISGLALRAAALEAGIDTYHGSAGRLLQNKNM